MACQRLFERSQAPAVGLAGAFQMTVQLPAAHIFGEDRLPELPGMQVGGLLHLAQALDHVRRQRRSNRTRIPGNAIFEKLSIWMTTFERSSCFSDGTCPPRERSRA